MELSTTKEEVKQPILRMTKNIGLRKHIAAILIQKIWRGYATRKFYQEKRDSPVFTPESSLIREDHSLSSVNSSTLFEHASPAKSYKTLESSYREGNIIQEL